ncbi:MAG: 50S ribosomal protein L4 [Dehalococcoidales bacterium]|nr:50S ribosomal protein L4 [Dehalococcoidales bacterium]MDP6737874.1 50S ribosomal protein L4 [Dehalococcoidales bacterium]
MQLPVHSLTKKAVDYIEVSDYVFAVPFNEAVVHQALVSQHANARQGTASTKTRSKVVGSTRKLYAQKHTGNARTSSVKSPLRRGGGVIFGPEPRDYRQALPKKMRRLALRCLLSAKARDGELIVVEELGFAEPKTKVMAQILSALGVDSSALVVTPQSAENVVKSAHNIPGVKIIPANLLNTVALLNHKKIVLTMGAVRTVNELWGEKLTAGASNAKL